MLRCSMNDFRQEVEKEGLERSQRLPSLQNQGKRKKKREDSTRITVCQLRSIFDLNLGSDGQRETTLLGFMVLLRF